MNEDSYLNSLQKKQRVVIIAPSAPPRGAGGVASAHYHLYRCLVKRGLDVVLLTFNEVGPTGMDPEIIRFGASRLQRVFLALCCLLFLKIRGSRKLAYQLNDIVASMPGIIKLNKVLRRLDPDHIIIPDHGAPGLLLDKGRARLTMVAHHNPVRFINNPALDDCCAVDVDSAVWLEQRVLQKVDGVIAPSRYMEAVFRDTFNFSGPVAMIHNPVDAAYIDSINKNDIRAVLGLSGEAPLVYIPSAGSKLKGAWYVAGIIRRLSEVWRDELGFYLSGYIPDELKAEFQNLPGNVRVYMPGHMEYAGNLAVIKACNFGISPTLIENFGMAIIEANYCGLPMVVFRVGGTGEAIYDGKNGYCVPCHDVDQLLNAAERLLDDTQCRELSKSALQFSHDHFNAETIVDRYLAFCHIGECGGSIDL